MDTSSGARDMSERRRKTREEKLERSGSVPRNLRDGANLHIGGIFSREPLRSRGSPTKHSDTYPRLVGSSSFTHV
jgi:hypothetical protein